MDRAALRIADDLHLLYLASRPGYLDFQGSSREAGRRFAAEMGAEEVRLAVVLLTASEMRCFYRFDLCGLYRGAGVEPLHYPVEDGSIPGDLGSFHRLVKTVHRRLATGKVLVHCNAGLGRTGVVAAGLLVFAGSGPHGAISSIRKVRNGALENRVQEEFIHRYHRAVSGGVPPR